MHVNLLIANPCKLCNIENREYFKLKLRITYNFKVRLIEVRLI